MSLKDSSDFYATLSQYNHTALLTESCEVNYSKTADKVREDRGDEGELQRSNSASRGDAEQVKQSKRGEMRENEGK